MEGARNAPGSACTLAALSKAVLAAKGASTGFLDAK